LQVSERAIFQAPAFAAGKRVGLVLPHGFQSHLHQQFLQPVTLLFGVNGKVSSTASKFSSLVS